jgi:hypothetical protein
VDTLRLNLAVRIILQPPRPWETMVAQMLASHAQERQSIVQELVWGVVASAEFRFIL